MIEDGYLAELVRLRAERYAAYVRIMQHSQDLVRARAAARPGPRHMSAWLRARLRALQRPSQPL